MRLLGIFKSVPALGAATVISAAISANAIAGSLAMFNDQEAVDGSFSQGAIVLDDAKVDALALSTSNMMPGDSVTDDVVIENDGSSQLRYSLSTSSTNDDGKNVRTQLTLAIKGIDVDGVGCGSFDGASVLAATALFDGESYAGFGNSAAGAHSGDRNVDAAANETLCFRVTLPFDTGNDYQGASTTTTFTFDAEQTANNP